MNYQRVKRVLDLTGGGFLLLLAAPLYVLCVFCIWLTVGRPVHFRQERLGRGGRSFMMYKFRSMNDRRDEAGRLLPDTERINLLGRFLRHTSLDELPQFINIIKGEMSFVGPRPQLACFTEDCSSLERQRFEVLPGLTGLAQIKGRNAITWRQKFRFDVLYVERQSLWLDLLIMLLTVPAVLQRRGIEKSKPEAVSCTVVSPDGSEMVNLDPAFDRKVKDEDSFKVHAAKGS